MSSPVKHVTTSPAGDHGETAAVTKPKKGNGNYKGFVAGIFSGIAKLTVGYAQRWAETRSVSWN